ncbi:hypothetical protein J000_06710 [Cryptococcus neoformans]|nr:hypothetical protein J000_06710 [Cryptococcus neoformans var. grubii]
MERSLGRLNTSY